MNFIISWEQGFGVSYFTHDASNCPEIDAFIVGSLTQEQFRSPVPSRGHIIRQVIISLGPLPRETKITQF